MTRDSLLKVFAPRLSLRSLLIAISLFMLGVFVGSAIEDIRTKQAENGMRDKLAELAAEIIYDESGIYHVRFEDLTIEPSLLGLLQRFSSVNQIEFVRCNFDPDCKIERRFLRQKCVDWLGFKSCRIANESSLFTSGSSVAWISLWRNSTVDNQRILKNVSGSVLTLDADSLAPYPELPFHIVRHPNGWRKLVPQNQETYEMSKTE